jgi:hypothetical protein
MKIYTISPVKRPSFRAAAAAYVGTFGVLWLFIEPLGAFGLLPTLNRVWSIGVYAVLILVPSVLLPFFLRGYRWYKTHNLPLIYLTIHSASDGVTYSIRAAENMQVGDFLSEFSRLLLRGPGHERVEAISHHYYPILQVRRDGQFVDVESNNTIRSAGLRDQDECQVRGQIHEEFNQVMYYKRK